MLSLKISVLLFCLAQSVWAYKIPNPIVKVYCKGFEVSIPHEDGVKRVQLSSERMSAKNCRAAGTRWLSFTPSYSGTLWTYKNIDIKLKNGDVFCFWIFVKKNRQSYSQFYTIPITEINKETSANEPRKYGNTAEMSQYRIPEPSVKSYRRAFIMSIPHHEGIEFVKFTNELKSDGNTCWQPFTLSQKNKIWTYKNNDQVFSANFRFWISVRKSGSDYVERFPAKASKAYKGTTANKPATDLLETFQYKVPNPTIKAYSRGFEICIPHEKGIELVEFSVELMSAFGLPYAIACWQEFTFSAKDKLWTYKNVDVAAEKGDIFRLWISVRKDGSSFLQAYTSKISEIHGDGLSGLHASPQYIRPKPIIKVHSKGFEVSIPHEDGMELVNFSVNLMSPDAWLYGGTCWLPFTLTHDNKLWTYKDVRAEHKLGSIFKFWIAIKKYEKYYVETYTTTVLKIDEESPAKETEASGLGKTCEYSIPNPLVNFYQQGFEVSLPHAYGIELVDFRAELISANGCPNSPICWQLLTLADQHKLWTYKNVAVAPKVGDFFRLWLVVKRYGADFLKAYTYQVSEICKQLTTEQPKTSDPANMSQCGTNFLKSYTYQVAAICNQQPKTSDLGKLSQYTMPNPTFKAYRIGFEVSIPHEDGIQVVEFSSERMSAESIRAAGTCWPPFTRSINGLLWTFKNTNVKLKNGDIFCFWIFVSKNTQNYVKFYTIPISKIDDETTATQPETFGLGKIFKYTIPMPNFKAYGKGFEVSLPHEEGIEFVELRFANGDTSCKPFTLSDKKELWSYKNFDVVHKLGDVLTLWISLRKEGFTYRKSFIFLIFKIYEETARSVPEKPAPPATSQYTVPNPSLKVHGTDFEISIPHEDGIEFVLFSITFNSEVKDLAGNVIFEPDVNGQWTDKISHVEIHKGDVINCSIFVKKNGRDFVKEDLVYIVDNLLEEENNESAGYIGY